MRAAVALLLVVVLLFGHGNKADSNLNSNSSRTTTSSIRKLQWFSPSLTSATAAETEAGADEATAAGSSNNQNNHNDKNNCHKTKIRFDDRFHKPKYKVAVHAISGFEQALQQYNLTFEAYLTATAGQRFDPPIEFELVPVDYNGLFELVESQSVDFFYANPGSYSCIGVEMGARPLVTTISEIMVRGLTFDLDVFGGVIFTKADNHNISTIYDLRDKVVATGGLNVIMGGQAQLYEMVKAGMDYVMDPAQLVFTGNQNDVIVGVLNGEFDVGMVRTEQIEKSVDDDGDPPFSTDVFKILEPKVHVLDDGNLFPFLHSTEIVPEWPVASLTYVPSDVSIEVQSALLALSDHARPFKEMMTCQQAVLDGTIHQDILAVYDGDSDTACNAAYWRNVIRCDTTPELSRLAYQAYKAGGIEGFRDPRSYFDVRSMHERAGFMRQNEETGRWSCLRADSLYDSLTCPPQHYKMTPTDFDQSCSRAGLECKEGYQCYCKPCIKAFEVDVYQYFPHTDQYFDHDQDGETFGETQEGCEKMTLCGIAEQRENIIVRILDNQRRRQADVTSVFHLGQTTHSVPVKDIGNYTYEMEWSEVEVGVGILQVYVNGEEIQESPFRIQIIPRSCHDDIVDGGGKRVPDQEGNCICAEETYAIGGQCFTSTALAVACSLFGLMLVLIIAFLVIEHKTYKNDSVWHVNADDLCFDDPVEVIGEGAFGVVLLAEYRGTKVAIKRAIRYQSSDQSRLGALNSNSTKGKGQSAENSRPSVGVESVEESITSSEEGTPDVEAPMEKAPTYKKSVSFDPDQESFEEESASKITTSPGRVGPSMGSQSRKGASGIFDLDFLKERYGNAGKHKSMHSIPHNKFNSVNTQGGGYTSASRGSHAVVRKVLCPWFDEDAKREKEFLREMRLLSSLRHPCICTVMGAVVAKGCVPMLVMEYMEYGSLRDLLANETMYLSGEIILQVSRDIAQGLRYLHAAKPAILHGDLKPANILVDSRFRAKVCDFGLSRKKKNAISGSLYWLAPEFLTGNDKYTPACDMYSMGIILNEVYSRQRPYIGEDADLKTLLMEICDSRINKRPTMPETMAPKMAALAKRLWGRDASSRLSAKELDTALMDMNSGDAEPLTLEQVNATPREDMLYEIFPRHIAEALKAGKKVEPETHDMVTIVFSDIKGFTDISREISPMKVSMMLDRLYLAFDRIARKHGVFKVETIGDAYMGVTNLVEAQEEDHVKRIAEFAVDMINEAGLILIDEDSPSKGYIKIRVGFHSGPVVANVIGSLNPRYGLFGDTVNTASRMESNSAGSRILCSESSCMLLKRQAPDMPLKSRGKIAVKGKGEMFVYWVGDKLISSNKKKNRLEAKEGLLGPMEMEASESMDYSEELRVMSAKQSSGKRASGSSLDLGKRASSSSMGLKEVKEESDDQEKDAEQSPEKRASARYFFSKRNVTSERASSVQNRSSDIRPTNMVQDQLVRQLTK